MNYTFEDGFMWGGACSGPQSEGRYEGDGDSFLPPMKSENRKLHGCIAANKMV